MTRRALADSPTAVACTLAGAVAMGTVTGVGLGVTGLLYERGVATDPRFLGGVGHLVYVALAGLVVVVASLVWVPFGAGVSYAVGRGVRGSPASVAETVTAVDRSRASLYRWTKTRLAVGPLADQLLGEDDVSPAEVAAGCEPYVVPAMVLDAEVLPLAVERANRVTPPQGRERLLLGGGLATIVLAACSLVAVRFAVESIGPFWAAAVALAVVVAGSATIAGVDADRRTRVYLSRDWSDGFRGD